MCEEECGEKKAQTAKDSHLKRHAGQRPFLCADCPKKFKRSNQLEYHKRSHKAMSNICDLCGKHYESAHYITVHMKTVHQETQENLPCDICGKVFAYLCRLKDHKKRNHSDDCYRQCSLCGIKIRMANYKVIIQSLRYVGKS